MEFPKIRYAQKLTGGSKRLFISAYGFETRATGWLNYQFEQGNILSDAFFINYLNPKGDNRINECRYGVNQLGVQEPVEIDYDIFGTRDIEYLLEKKLKNVNRYDEVIVDITAMTKLLILICLSKLSEFRGTVRIVYSEAKDYAPTEEIYERSKTKMEELAQFPSRGFETILRSKSLSSIRMQGQPVVLIAFASFNEQLIRHLLGTINPHRLIFINGRPPRKELQWRELATQEIHSKLIEEYPIGNDLDEKKLLKRSTSTLNYIETINQIDEIYETYGLFERIIIAATGSKMQTVGLFFSKMIHPDIHIEYPTPDSYFIKGLSTGILNVHEILIESFSSFLITCANQRFHPIKSNL